MLQLNDISKTFNPGTVTEKRALNHLKLDLKDGDFATVVGSNGAGKSTMFNAIAGSFYVDEGTIMLDGEDVTFQKEYRRSSAIGHLFQDPLKGTAPNMSIEENLSIAYLRASRSRHAIFSRVSRADREKFRQQLSLLGMGLEDRMKSPVGLLSGGQRQALTLLMATMVTPKLLLLDEHTAALDPATAEKVLKLTREIVAERKIPGVRIKSVPGDRCAGSPDVCGGAGCGGYPGSTGIYRDHCPGHGNPADGPGTCHYQGFEGGGKPGLCVGDLFG